MSLQALKNINRTAAANNEQPQGFPAMLEQFKGEIARALPKHINPDRMARIALTAFRMTPKLGECDPRSVFAAVIQSPRNWDLKSGSWAKLTLSRLATNANSFRGIPD